MRVWKKLLTAAMAVLLLVQSLPATVHTNGATATHRLSAPVADADIDSTLELSSWEIASLAERTPFSANAIDRRIEKLEQAAKQREDTFKNEAKAAEKEIESKEQALHKLSSPGSEEQRKALQCEILAQKKQLTDKTFDFLQEQVAIDVKMAKLQLLREWPAAHAELARKINDNTIGDRKHGDVLNIGYRGTNGPFRGHENDVDWGQREIDAAKQRNELPKQIDDAVVTEYVSRLTTTIARHSDLQVPPKIFVVRQELRKAGRPVLDKEGRPQQVANAMALPGGFLFVYSGLILESETEAELAGVIAHEISHAAARHSHRLANKGKVFGIVQLASAIGLHVFAPGLFQAASYLGYQLKSLLIQGIFQGLGLVFTLEAMGVSRDFELEADQLGMQYAWKAGYDPRGFVDLFDRMSKKDGYASRTSFFATHPAFGDRTLNALREYTALHSLEPNRVYRSDTSEFQEIKQRLRSYLRSTETQERKQQLEDRENRPTLLRAHEIVPEVCESEQFAGSRRSMVFPSGP